MTVIRVGLEHRFGVPLRYGFDYITDPGNWAEYWPGFIRLEAGWRWNEPGDRVRLVLRLLGRPVELEMTLKRLVPYRLVEYTSVQPGFPDAHHERHFEAAGNGFHYRLAVDLEQRRGTPRRILDRALVRPATARAMRRTLSNLDRRFGSDPAGLGDDEGV